MLKSIQMNKKGILLMLISSLCVCIGQLLWKLSADRGIIVMLAGFLFYGAGALVMLVAYRFGKLSVLCSEREHYYSEMHRCDSYYRRSGTDRRR